MLSIFCKHKLEQISKVTIWADGANKATDTPIGYTFAFLCYKCGKVKKIKL